MHQAWRSSLAGLLAAVLITAGCSPRQRDTLSIGAWLDEIRTQAGIDENSTASSLEALKAYGVIEEQPDPDASLTREYTAYTLVNLLDSEPQEASIRDIDYTVYPEEVKTAVHDGMFTLDLFGRFHPKSIMEKEAAETLLSQAVYQINNRTFTRTENIEMKPNIPVLDIEPISFDESSLKAVLPEGTDLQGYQGIQWTNEDGEEFIYDIAEAEEGQNGLEVQLKEADLLAYTDEMELSGSSGLNFEEAEIITGDTGAAEIFSDDPFLENTASATRTRTFNVAGYQIVLKTGSGGVSAELSKELANSLKATGKLKMSGVNVDYRFFTLKKDVNNAYFKVNLHTEESIGVTAGPYKKIFGDFSKTEPLTFLSTLSSFLKSKTDMESVEIPICKIRIPLEASTLVEVTVGLSLMLYASGKASLVLSQDNTVGFEMRNGVPRFIHDSDHKETNSIKADTALTGKLTFALEALKTAIMDIGIETGAKAAVNTTVHLYDEEGGRTAASTNLSADAVDELSSGNPRVLVCADLSAHLLLKIKINSRKTLAGKCGLHGDLNLMDEDSGVLFGGPKHFENWHTVDACTRKDYKREVEASAVPKTDKIRIASYAIALKQGETKTIRVTGIPEGYSMNDLVFSISGSAAAVSASGTVTGMSAGSGVVTIATSDGKYKVECSVLVTEGNIT
jgi:hypothetical protein